MRWAPIHISFCRTSSPTRKMGPKPQMCSLTGLLRQGGLKEQGHSGALCQTLPCCPMRVPMHAAGPTWSRLQIPRLGTSGSFPLFQHSTSSMMVMPCCMWDHVPWVSCWGCPGESVHSKVHPDRGDNSPHVCMRQRGNPFPRESAAWEREEPVREAWICRGGSQLRLPLGPFPQV